MKKNTPKKPKGELFTELVMLRLTKKEKKNLLAMMKSEGKSYGRFISEKLGL